MKKIWLAGLLVAIVVMAGGAYLWINRPVPPPPPAVPSLPAPVAKGPQVVAPPSGVASEPATLHPIEPPTEAGPMVGDAIAPALIDLLGRKAVDSLLRTDDFAHRFVATVDNLGRDHAAAMLWPVNPTPGRFTAESRGGATVIAADNGMRYTPFVLMIEAVDSARAVDLYVRMYPMLQQAYQELGYPKRYFNDRLIEVIDQLLATPDLTETPRVTLTEIKGPVPSLRPWIRYEYADPALESLSAGQKILLRAGPVNERRLKARLTEFRRALIQRETGRSPPR